MRDAIEKLHLQEGDIVIVHDTETMWALQSLAEAGTFKDLPNCPIVFVPGGISLAKKEDLVAALATLEPK